MVNIRRIISGGTWPSVVQIGVAAGRTVGVYHLQSVAASGNTGILGKPGGRGRDVVHAPVRNTGCGIECRYDETARAARGVRPRQLGRLISAGGTVQRANVGAVVLIVVNHAERQSSVVLECHAAQRELFI